MAATISANSAGGGGVVISGDATAVLALQTASVTALSISAAQVVSFTNPPSLVGTNITGTATAFTASNVTTNANLTGAITSVGNTSSLGSFTSANLAAALTDETGTGANVFATSPTLVTPALGTPASGVVTNLTGTASININGTVGATTATTGAFTTLDYTGTLTGGTGVVAIGTNQIYKDASGNVGIGTSSPSSKLHLLTPSAANVELRIGNSLSYNSLLIDSAGDSRLYTPALNQIFSVNSAERMRIDSVGNVTLQENISVGAAAPTTSGTGITFPATQAASSNANTLDDYEEGTYTPVLSFATNGTMTYTASSTNGSYTKIGNVVTCKATITLSAFSAGSAAGQARISLPFTVENSTGVYTGAVYGGVFTTLFPTLALTFFNQIFLTLYGNTAINTTPTILGPGNFTATSIVSFSISYKV